MWLEAPQERCLLQRLGCSWQRTFPVCHPAEHPPGQDSPVFQPRHGKVEEPEPSNKPCCPAGPSGEGSVQQRVRISCAEECQGSRWLQSQTPLEVMPSVPLDVHTALVYLSRLPTRILGFSVAANEGWGCSMLEDKPGAKGDHSAGSSDLLVQGTRVG